MKEGKNSLILTEVEAMAEKKKEEMELSRRQFLDKGAKGAAVAAYVAPAILTVSLNTPAWAGKDDDRGGQGLGHDKGRGKGHDVSEVDGKGKGKGHDRD